MLSKSFKNSKESSIKSLNLMVKRGHKVDVEYSRKFLIDRINTFLGYEFINKIKLRHFKKRRMKKIFLALTIYWFLLIPVFSETNTS